MTATFKGLVGHLTHAGVLPMLGSEPAPALEDLLWALLNTPEFVYSD